MATSRVTIIGGGGFVGSHLAQVLAARGIEVIIPTRRRERVKPELIVLPTVDVVSANVHDDTQLDGLVVGADAVVNLVGILHERGRSTFQSAHVELAQRVARACRRSGVARLLHMSALGAAETAPSEYLRTKAGGESAVRAAASEGIAVTIFRPSVIFGRGDSFLSLFARLQRWVPIIALGSPNARFQPIWVEDVAHAFADALHLPETIGASYDLCGPTVYTLHELMVRVGDTTGRRRPVIRLGDRLSYLQALVLEHMPRKLITRDNYRSMKVDSVCDCPYPAVFGGTPARLEAVLASYLGTTPRGHYDGLRSRARR